MNLNDEIIFTILSTKQKKIQDQIMNISNPKQLEKIFKELEYKELIFLLLVRSQEQQENVLEKMLKNPNNNLNAMLDTFYSTYKDEQFYTEKMLMMVIKRNIN